MHTRDSKERDDGALGGQREAVGPEESLEHGKPCKHGASTAHAPHASAQASPGSAGPAGAAAAGPLGGAQQQAGALAGAVPVVQAPSGRAGKPTHVSKLRMEDLRQAGAINLGPLVLPRAYLFPLPFFEFQRVSGVVVRPLLDRLAS